ncbi:MAG: TauD/TfdA family dioxygenase [Actinomycetota bacterium]
MAALTIAPLDGARFGAEITGLDPLDISAADRAAVWDAYRHRHGLLCFSFDRLLRADELHALTAVFGENEFAPGLITGIGRGVADGEEMVPVAEQEAALRARGIDPYLMFLGNVDPETGEPKKVAENFFGEWEWHTDMSYIEVPPTFSLLHARIVPERGGDTGYCSQVMAAAELPADLRARVQGRSIKHDSTYASNGNLRPGMAVPSTPIDAVGHAHPILRRVTTTGDEALFLGRRTNGYVLGLELDESEALLDELWAHATRPEFCYRHRWSAGQVVVWDNRMMLHKREPVDSDEVRFMWRTQTRGEAVVAA